MKTDLVPQDVYTKHENEWQALRKAAENRIDIRRTERPDVFHSTPALRTDWQQRL